MIVEDLDRAIGEFTAQGFRLEMIMPADEPHSAIVSRDGTQLRLETTRSVDPERQASSKGLIVTRESADDQWHRGRAGMEYRDLIPGRLGGSCVASHIRIQAGGVTADYVHYHKVNFQMLFCRRGWARLVYQDQGPAFLFEEGDCVLQPPTIRHRVLETSSGFEVIEVSAPAVHETWVEHQLTLPSPDRVVGRSYGGQPFLLSKAAAARWVREEGGAEIRDTGIGAATKGLGSVIVARCEPGVTHYVSRSDRAGLLFVLQGQVSVGSCDQSGVDLKSGDSAVVPAGSGASITFLDSGHLLQVTLPVEQPV